METDAAPLVKQALGPVLLPSRSFAYPDTRDIARSMD